MSEYLIPILIVMLLVFSFIKKKKPFNSFATGAGKAFKVMLDVFPFLIGIFLMIKIMEASGIMGYLAKLLSPVLTFLGIPPELSMLMILRPFSGSGCTAILSDIFVKFGVDSYIGRAASVVMASSDTLMYITAIYLSKCNTRKLLWTLPIGFFISILSGIIACFLCRVI